MPEILARAKRQDDIKEIKIEKEVSLFADDRILYVKEKNKDSIPNADKHIQKS